VVLPAARQGLLAALILAFARAVGETMAVLMVCGNVARLPHSLFDPVRTLTATIALEMGYARGDHRSALFVCGLLLLLLVLALVGVTEKLGRTGRSHRAA
jgi:phosphate transport system permease protein